MGEGERKSRIYERGQEINSRVRVGQRGEREGESVVRIK
jgi:hypothetical protein